MPRRTAVSSPFLPRIATSSSSRAATSRAAANAARARSRSRSRSERMSWMFTSGAREPVGVHRGRAPLDAPGGRH